jgi:hypothetical protein
MTRRHAGLFKEFKLGKGSRKWMVLGVLTCNPLIIGASLTYSIANCFNVFFYRCRLQEAENERQEFGARA